MGATEPNSLKMIAIAETLSAGWMMSAGTNSQPAEVSTQKNNNTLLNQSWCP